MRALAIILLIQSLPSMSDLTISHSVVVDPMSVEVSNISAAVKTSGVDSSGDAMDVSILSTAAKTSGVDSSGDAVKTSGGGSSDSQMSNTDVLGYFADDDESSTSKI